MTDSTWNADNGSKSTTTRKATHIYGLGPGISKTDSILTGSRIPTCNQIVRCLMWFIKEGEPQGRSKWQAAKIVMAQLENFYRKANIPMISKTKAIQKMIILLDENAKIRAIPKSRRELPASQEKVQNMKIRLQETFAIWPCNIEKLIKNHEDLAFLQSMKTDRTATFGALDKINAERVKRKGAYLSAANERKRNHEEQASAIQEVQFNSNSTCHGYTNNEDETFQPFKHRSHKRLKKTGTSVFIPHDILKRPKVVSLATRMKLTPSQQTAFTQCIIEEAGGNADIVSLSYATADRSRRQVVQKISTTNKDSWQPPLRLTLHWDSKLTPSVKSQNELEERITVSVGNIKDVKLLGVPSYKPGSVKGSGIIISELVIDILKEWNCADRIVNMAFDTTASNTGHVSAACISIQKRLGRALLWSPCRYHIGEVVLSQIFKDLKIEVSQSPEVTLFSRFKKNYYLLSERESQNFCKFSAASYSPTAQEVIYSLQVEAIEVARENLHQKRDDYLEFVELCLVFLDGYPEERSFSMKRPGAMHRARWMSKTLYSFKMSLLQDEIGKLPTGKISSSHQCRKLREFATFVALLYSSWWMQCSVAVDAPWNDLLFFKKLLRYSCVSKVIHDSAVKAFSRHMWYLTSEMVPMALFSSKVPPEHKKSLATSLMAVKSTDSCTHPKGRYGSGFGKPSFPGRITLETTLADLVGPDSWFIFHLLQLNPTFLTSDVSTWSAHPAYQEALITLECMNVVNDSSERNIKLTTDYITSARGEEHYQNVLQVVEADRKEKPNLRNRKY